MQDLPVPSQTKTSKAFKWDYHSHVGPIVLNLHSQSDQLFHLLLAICFALHPEDLVFIVSYLSGGLSS